jgi:serine phosphatase RsbU (regulator of sigma subunit)
MAIFRSLIRAFAQQHGAEACGHERHGARVAGAPGTTILKHAVELTNSYIAENHSSTNMFATLFFGVLDLTTGRLVYGNGGHEAPIVFPPGGEVKSRLQPTGPAVGMFPDVEFGVVEVVLDRGETLLAFTDGVPDARNEQRAFFTEERLLALLKEPALSVVALLDRIEESLKAHTGHADPFDDVTLLAVRRE